MNTETDSKVQQWPITAQHWGRCVVVTEQHCYLVGHA